MENEKKNSKLLPILLIVIIILVTIVAFLYKKQYDSLKKESIIDNETPVEINGTPVKINEKLSEEKGKELWDKASLKSETFVQDLINSDFGGEAFTDEHIAYLLSAIDAYKENKSTFNLPLPEGQGEGSVGKVENVQKLAEKYFGRKLDVSKLRKDASGNIIVPGRMGYGILNNKYIEGYKTGEKEYTITFETSDYDGKDIKRYTLTIEYDEKTDQVVYKNLKSN